MKRHNTIVFVLVWGLLVCCGAGSGCETRAERIRSEHPEWGQATVDQLAGRNLKPGMTRDMVRTAMGKPDAVSTKGEEEVWGYAYWHINGLAPARQIFVYFVHFKGDSVVRTRGDTVKLQTVY